MDPHVAAHVPIKKHSQRLPRKNFREFNGKPLYYWIFQTLEQVDQIDEIFLNTDSEKIMEDVGSSFDVTVIERPEEYRGQHVSMNDILVHDSSIIDADIYLHTHCTAPLLKPATLQDAVRQFLDDDEHDSLFSGTKHKKWFYDSQFNPINHDPKEVERSQDLEPIYEEDGILYVIPHDILNKYESRVGESPILFELSPVENIEIDYDYELDKAEFFHKRKAIENTIARYYDE